MKIFLSWSGPRSRIIAEALNEWLKRVIQLSKPFYSPDMDKGIRFGAALDEELEGSHFGIICLTPDNLGHTWINYEAGALSKIASKSRVWTFLHGLDPSDVPQPLGRFQHTVAEKDDIWKLLQSINKRLPEVKGESIDEAVLRDSFEANWGKLEEKLIAAKSVAVASEEPRDDREILLEILEIVRSQQRAEAASEHVTHKWSTSNKVELASVFKLSKEDNSSISKEEVEHIRVIIHDNGFQIREMRTQDLPGSKRNEFVIVFAEALDMIQMNRLSILVKQAVNTKIRCDEGYAMIPG